MSDNSSDYSKWNEKRPYDFLDREPRYLDENGFWHKYDFKNTKKDWEVDTGEQLNDWRGQYVLLVNGIKIYNDIDPLVAKDIRNGKYRVAPKTNYHYLKVDYKKKYKPSNI